MTEPQVTKVGPTVSTVPSLVGPSEVFFLCHLCVYGNLLSLWWIFSFQSFQNPSFHVPSGNLTQLWKITMSNGKTHYKWKFSIAMLVYQRVIPRNMPCFQSDMLKPNSPHSDALPTQVGLHPDDVTYLEAMVDVEDWNGYATNEGSMLLFNLDRTYTVISFLILNIIYNGIS